MKYICMMFLGAAFTCHASELQKHPEDVRLVMETLCNLYNAREIKPRANEDTEATKTSDMSTKAKILLRLGRDGQEIHLQTREGLFELPTRKNVPITFNLEIKLKKALKDTYTITDALPDEGISCCTSDCTFIYELKRKE